jgi:hypothetical protein
MDDPPNSPGVLFGGSSMIDGSGPSKSMNLILVDDPMRSPPRGFAA